MLAPLKIAVAIDTREQKPLRFPEWLHWHEPGGARHSSRIETFPVTLESGDYSIATSGRTFFREVAVERKGSWAELRQNLLTADFRRFRHCLQRLAALPMATLAMDMPYNLAVQPGCPEPVKVLDALLRAVARTRLPLLWLPFNTHRQDPHKAAEERGEVVLRLMWQQAWYLLQR